jgi:hypothetical protein
MITTYVKCIDVAGNGGYDFNDHVYIGTSGGGDPVGNYTWSVSADDTNVNWVIAIGSIHIINPVTKTHFNVSVAGDTNWELHIQVWK